MRSSFARVLCGVCLCLASTAISAQRANPPLEIWDVRGTWLLDEKGTQGLIANRGSAGGLLDPIGFRASRRLVVVTTETAISISQDNAAPVVFPYDGIERPLRDERTGVELDISHRFTFVAGMPALTTSQTIRNDAAPGKATIVTDALRVEGDVLTVERQHSVLAKDGTLLPLTNSPRRSTLIYRRAPL